MAFFGKLFEKKVCDLCGGEIGLLGNKKLEDGNCCKECAGKLSPWFDERRHSTVEQIQRQLTAREENRRKLQSWNHDLVFGEHQKLYVKFLGKIPDTFVISSASNYKEANADILEFAHVSSCDSDIRESRRELKQKNAQGEEVSYNPPRYEYSYEFYVKLMIMGCEYIDDIRFRLNRNTLKLETIQRGSGRGLMFNQTFDPMQFPEYRELKNELDTVCRLFSCGQRGVHYEAQTANSGDGIQSLLEQMGPALIFVKTIAAVRAVSGVGTVAMGIGVTEADNMLFHESTIPSILFIQLEYQFFGNRQDAERTFGILQKFGNVLLCETEKDFSFEKFREIIFKNWLTL